MKVKINIKVDQQKNPGKIIAESLSDGILI